MALATARDIGASVLIISEPNRQAIRGRKDWIFDANLDTAIKLLDSKIPVENQCIGPGFSYISTGELAICSCYCSGNDEINDLEETLSAIGDLVRNSSVNTIIAGDFNAKSPQWGMNLTDSRGKVMTEWIASNDLIVVNKGDTPTFQRENYGSVLDLTLVTDKTNVSEWEVMDTESLSDHNYVVFDITNKVITQQKTEDLHTNGWNIRKLDPSKVEIALQQIPEGLIPPSAIEFSKRLTQICNTSMPKKRKPNTLRKPVYWWNSDLAELRRNCVQTRRTYTRTAKRGNLETIGESWEIYQSSRKALRNAIKKAKRAHWKELCEAVNCDIWGDGYKIVMKGLLGYPPRINLNLQNMEKVANYLFPNHNDVVFDCDSNAKFPKFTQEELKMACSKLKNNKAPGPGRVPAEILKVLAEERPKYVLSTFNQMAMDAEFPAIWKKARLLLLRKGTKPLENPSSYRPICLLDVEGKLYEQLLLGRLHNELIHTGGLSDKQYGFRKGRQTVDAINRVRTIARSAEEYTHAHRRLCAMITIDVKNAFNSASWQLILENLRRRKIDESLISIISSYFSERKVLLETDENSKSIRINSGVPQGSVLGPTLWNILYDDLLESEMPDGVELVGFADDVAMVVVARNEEMLMNMANTGLQRVSDVMQRMHLTIAPEKTEAVLLTKKRQISPVSFKIQNITVTPKNAVKYLGVWMDTKLTFAEHIKKTIQKAELTGRALSTLMPNIGGPKASKRKLYSGVVHSQILYGAPAWHEATNNKKLMVKLSSLQRTMSIRVTSAYRTISTEAVGVIAGISPIELQIIERRERYTGTPTYIAKENLLRHWQDKWDRTVNGRWTHHLIPVIQKWTNRQHGEVDYFISQALSGHGCYKKYLYDRRRADSDECEYCMEVDDAPHTLFACIRWSEVRQTFQNETGKQFNPVNMMQCLLETEEMWNYTYKAIKTIINAKEREQRLNRRV